MPKLVSAVNKQMKPNHPSLRCHSGETWQSKVKRLRQELAKKKVDGIIISALNEIACELVTIKLRTQPRSILSFFIFKHFDLVLNLGTSVVNYFQVMTAQVTGTGELVSQNQMSVLAGLSFNFNL